MADSRWYDQGTRPRILINWNSFVRWGIPNEWQIPFQDIVINAYTRWMNMAGVDLRFQFWGYTDRTESNEGELVISMNEYHAVGESRLASTFGSYNRLIIVFHRKSGDLSSWNFVPHAPNDGEIDMYGVLLHELGHCLGLEHSAGSGDVMTPWYFAFNRYGLFRNDVEREQAVYNFYTQNRLRQLASRDGGTSWITVANNLTNYNHNDARTNLNIGVTATPISSQYIIGYSSLNRKPIYTRGNGTSFELGSLWLVYGGEDSILGPAFANDNAGNMLYAWVDNDDNGSIRVTRSTDNGNSWFWTGVPMDATTYGTPGLCHTVVDGVSTWVLVWSYFDTTRSNLAVTGRIRASISTNNGDSWSVPTEINTFYKALSGVSVAADRSNNIMIGFAWAPNSTTFLYGTNLIRTFKCRVSGGALVLSGVQMTNYGTRIQPALAFDQRFGRFVMAFREQNFNTSLNIISMTPSASSWSRFVRLENRSHVAPGLAYSDERGELVMWYAFE